MILHDDTETVLTNYDFTDSIVTRMYWDENLLDFKIEVDYFWSDETSYKQPKYLTLRFVNCKKLELNLPKASASIPTNEYSNYVFSWYTIVGFTIEKVSDDYSVEIKTVDENPKWLVCSCERIIIESM